MYRTTRALFASMALLLFSVTASWTASAETFSRLYVFGDSLSDTGNLASVRGDLPPPFFMNRITNGPVAVDVLAEKLGLSAEPSLHLIGPAVGTNYAIGGARARGMEFIDLTGQVAAFLANHGNVAPPDALYVFMIGGNDARDARNEPSTAGAERILDDAVAAVIGNVQTLLTAGARSIVVMDSPDLGLLPETRLIAEAIGNRLFILRATALSGQYAVKLNRALRELRESSGADVTGFSLFTFTRLLKTTARLFGITNTRDVCFSTQTFTFHPDCDNGANFDKFYFFDEIHPTAKVHGLAGRAIFAVVNPAHRPYALDFARASP